jgi:uncharacterized protein (DUF779 family)
MPVARVSVTPAAEAVLGRLGTAHGALLFHQSGGCCDGSSPMCYPDGDFITGDGDVLLGQIFIGDGESDDGPAVSVWMSKPQFEYWRHTHLTIDVVPGRGAGFSLEAPEGVRFLIRSRLFTEAELVGLGELPARSV